jgi:hypothetical protein
VERKITFGGVFLVFIKYVVVIFILVFFSSVSAKDSNYNLAFDEDFISYLSDRLALQLARVERLEPNPNLDKAESGFRQSHLMDLHMNYRSKLISCDGPLKEISVHLKNFESHYHEFYGKDKFNTGVLSFVSSKESEIWPIIEKWNEKVRDEIMKSHHIGFKVYPDCLVDGYDFIAPK